MLILSRKRLLTWRAAVPGAFALLLAAAPARALVISEVLYDASGSDAGAVFVELYGQPGTSLRGLVLEGINGSGGSPTTSVLLAGSIPSDGIFVLGSEVNGTTFVPNADLVLSFDFQNGPDSIVLRSDAGTLDAIGYGDFSPSEVFAGEGSPAPDPPGGSSLARLYANVDTNDNLADFVVLDTPTPGVASLLAVPQPSAAALVGSGLGLLGLAGAFRRPRSTRPRTRNRRGPGPDHTPTGAAALTRPEERSRQHAEVSLAAAAGRRRALTG